MVENKVFEFNCSRYGILVHIEAFYKINDMETFYMINATLEDINFQLVSRKSSFCCSCSINIFRPADVLLIVDAYFL